MNKSTNCCGQKFPKETEKATKKVIKCEVCNIFYRVDHFWSREEQVFLNILTNRRRQERERERKRNLVFAIISYKKSIQNKLFVN